MGGPNNKAIPMAAGRGTMTTSGLADERQFIHVADRRLSQRRSLIVALASFALGAAALGYLVGNQVQVNTQFDQAHASLHLTRHQTTVVEGGLAAVRRDLRILDAQVQTDTGSLASDSTQLTSMQAALLQAQSTVSQQGSTITDLTVLPGRRGAVAQCPVRRRSEQGTAGPGRGVQCLPERGVGQWLGPDRAGARACSASSWPSPS